MFLSGSFSHILIINTQHHYTVLLPPHFGLLVALAKNYETIYGATDKFESCFIVYLKLLPIFLTNICFLILFSLLGCCYAAQLHLAAAAPNYSPRTFTCPLSTRCCLQSHRSTHQRGHRCKRRWVDFTLWLFLLL